MVTVNLIAQTDTPPNILASHAANTCYAKDAPVLGKTIDIENKLFKPGHHTPFQHNYFTFALDKLPVSSVKFGLHLAGPYYNSCEQSGRYSKMYDSPDFGEIQEHVAQFYYGENIGAAMEFIKGGQRIYADNIAAITELAKQAIADERPYATDDYIKLNGPKMAQEQLRMFVSMMSFARMDYTVNLSAIAAMYRTAWLPELKDIMGKMADRVMEKHPETGFMFDVDKEKLEQSRRPWHPGYLADNRIKTIPSIFLRDSPLVDYKPGPSCGDTVDLGYFSPYTMDNSVQAVATTVVVSGATFGQDQRHRAIKRGQPSFSGAFYLPPLLDKAQKSGVASMSELAESFMKSWRELPVSGQLRSGIAPYGAMITYTKLSDLNGLHHEMGKRLCLCAQEEIWNVSKSLGLATHLPHGLAERFTPACFQNGACVEGARYCGRDKSIGLSETKRTV